MTIGQLCEGRFRRSTSVSLLFPSVREASLHPLGCCLGFEMLGTPRTSPLAELFPLLMVRVSQRLQIFLIASGAAHVLRRASSFALQAERVPFSFRGLQATFKEDFVFPVIAEVVLVFEMEAIAILRKNLADPRLAQSSLLLGRPESPPGSVRDRHGARLRSQTGVGGNSSIPSPSGCAHGACPTCNS